MEGNEQKQQIWKWRCQEQAPQLCLCYPGAGHVFSAVLAAASFADSPQNGFKNSPAAATQKLKAKRGKELLGEPQPSVQPDTLRRQQGKAQPLCAAQARLGMLGGLLSLLVLVLGTGGGWCGGSLLLGCGMKRARSLRSAAAAVAAAAAKFS